MHNEYDQGGSVQNQVNTLQRDVRELFARTETLAVFKSELEHLESSIQKLVTQMEFAPVRMIAYGLAGGVFMTVLIAVLSLVVFKR